MEEQQFLYVLKLRPDLLKEENWTDQDNKLVEEHFKRLEQDTIAGKVILAGRTLTGEDPEGFGIVIFKDNSMEDAQVYLDTDPTVKAGVMTAKLYPYRVALIQKK